MCSLSNIFQLKKTATIIIIRLPASPQISKQPSPVFAIPALNFTQAY